MKIGELAHRTGLRASAVRYYEKLGLLAPPQRASGQRRYSPEALDRVLLIRFAGEMGFSLTEIKLFLSGLRDNVPVGPRWKKLATKKLTEVEGSIARSLRLKTLSRTFFSAAAAPSNNASPPSALAKISASSPTVLVKHRARWGLLFAIWHTS